MNNLRDKMVKKLTNREEGLSATLKLTEERLIATEGDSEEAARFDAKACELGCELADVREVLRLLEAR